MFAECIRVESFCDQHNPPAETGFYIEKRIAIRVWELVLYALINILLAYSQSMYQAPPKRFCSSIFIAIIGGALMTATFFLTVCKEGT